MIHLIFQAVVTTSWVVSAAILIVLSLRKVLGRHMGVKFRQLLWIIILLRLFLPVVPESPLSLMNWVPSPQQITQAVIEEIGRDSIFHSIQKQSQLQVGNNYDRNTQNQSMLYKYDTLNRVQNHEAQGEMVRNLTASPIENILAVIWMLGVLFILGASAVSIVIFNKTNQKQERDVGLEILDKLSICKQNLGIKQNISIKQLPQLNSPILTGVWKRKIYLPKKLIEQTGNGELVHILLHELVHWKRRDTLWNLVFLLAISFHWFNPLVWIASQKMKEDWEMSCDMAVLEVIGEDNAISYGNAILQVVKFQNKRLKGLLCQTAFYGNRKQTKRRIMMINKFRSGMSTKITVVAVLLCILLGVVTLTDATSYATNVATDANSKMTVINSTDPYATPSEFQLYNPNYQYFDELESFCRYTDFSFQLPNYLPKIFQVNDYRIHRDEKQKNKSIVDIDYWYNTMGGAMVKGAVEEHFRLRISEDNLLEKMTPQLTEKQKKESHFTYHYKTKQKVVAGVSGIQLTDWRKHKDGYSSEGDNHYQGERKEYFIWQKNNIWYAMEYLTEMTAENKSYYLLNLSDKEVEGVISSFTDPAKLTNPGYYTKEAMPSFAVYDQYDLKRISRDWGYSPKLPMNLPGLKAKSADMRHVFYEDKEFGVFHIEYDSNEKTSSKIVAEYEQASLPAEYNHAEKMYQEQQKRGLKSNETAFILQTIQGKKVYAVEEKDKNTQTMYYFWDNGSFSMDGKLGDHTEILNILLSK